MFGLFFENGVEDASTMHPVKLEIINTRWSYLGWENDVQMIRNCFLEFELVRQLKNCKARQMAHDNEISASTMHPIKLEIVNTRWSYLGWENDIQMIRNCFLEFELARQLEKFKLRQMIHDNDISGHPALIQLSSLVLSYPGWESDIQQAKKSLRKHGYETGKYAFDQAVEGMKNKQKLFNSLRNNESKREEGPITESNKNTKDVGSCAICLDAPLTHVFVPCGHMCACQECSKKVIRKQRKCPICKQISTQAIQVFIA